MVTSLWTAQTLYLFGFTLAYGMSSTWTSEGNNWFIEKKQKLDFHSLLSVWSTQILRCIFKRVTDICVIGMCSVTISLLPRGYRNVKACLQLECLTSYSLTSQGYHTVTGHRSTQMLGQEDRFSHFIIRLWSLSGHIPFPI